MKAVVIIPARYGSTRFPGKPLVPLAGKPVIQHVWERCLAAAGVDQVIIATDDMRIAETAFAFGAEVSLTSPRHATGTDRVAEVAAKLRGAGIILNVQGDEPLVPPALITALISRLREDRSLPMATAAAPFAPDENPDSPNAVKVVCDARGRALLFSRSRIPFERERVPGLRPLRHIGIYAFRRRFLAEFVRLPRPAIERAESLEQLRALHAGYAIGVVLTKPVPPGVDTPEDLKTVERLLARRRPPLKR